MILNKYNQDFINMESENIHDQMARYDFKAPIEVMMIFEENEEDELTDIYDIKLESKNIIDEGILENNVVSDLKDAGKETLKQNSEPVPIFTDIVQKNSTNEHENDISKEQEVTNASKSSTKNYDNELKRKVPIECEVETEILKNVNLEKPNNCTNKQNEIREPMSNNYVNEIVQNNDNSHLNALDQNALLQVNAEIIKKLLETVSEHLLVIVQEHLKFLQCEKDKSINIYTLDRLKQYFLGLKYHYFGLSYCTVSTYLLTQEKNEGFIKRFLNHTLQLSTEKTISCTYNILEALYNEMIMWVKMKKGYVPNLSPNASNYNNNRMLRQQLQQAPYPNLVDTFKEKQVKNCIFKSGPPGREVQITVEPTLINQNRYQKDDGTRILIQQNMQQLRSKTQRDKTSLTHQNGQQRTIYENAESVSVEQSTNSQKNYTDSKVIYHNNQNNEKTLAPRVLQKRFTSETSSNHKLNKLAVSDQLSSHLNGELLNVGLSLAQQNTRRSSADIVSNYHYMTANPQNIQNVSPVSVPLHETETTSFQQNWKPYNFNSAISYPREQQKTEQLLIQNNKHRNRIKPPESSVQQNGYNSSPLQKAKYQAKTKTSLKQSWNHQKRQPETRQIHAPYTELQNKNMQLPPTYYDNYTNCIYSHHNNILPTNYQTDRRYPTTFQNTYYPPNVVPNYSTPARHPSNIHETYYRHHLPYNNDEVRELQQLQELSRGYHNREPETQHRQNLDISNVDTTRSSVSKDSGIMSPLNSDTSIDQLLSLPLIEDIVPTSTNMTPMIAHVTSLNPNAYHIIEGNCVVCHKSTNTKCLGCYKCYYCSSECQTKDWKFHMYTCRSARDAQEPHSI